jgi:signal transduction histidine kinase
VQTLQESDQRKDQFLAVLAHELRNLLAPIGYGVDLMRMSAEDPTVVRECCAATDRQLKQMVRLVDDLLDVTRVARGKMELRREHIGLDSVAASAIEISRPWIQVREQKLQVSMPAQPVQVDADPTRLTQVVANLLNNASKYSPAGAEIQLALERDGDDAVIRVRDRGIGIPVPELSRIFEMFSQIRQPLERTAGGLGIGLGLAKGIVELHSGSISARSEGPGQGSEFLVRLPALAGSQGTIADDRGGSIARGREKPDALSVPA